MQRTLIPGQILLINTNSLILVNDGGLGSGELWRTPPLLTNIQERGLFIYFSEFVLQWNRFNSRLCSIIRNMSLNVLYSVPAT